MLYDPKWETKINPFKLQSLIAWLEKRPSSAEYCYTDNGACLIAQYLSSTFGCEVLVGASDFCRVSADGKTFGRDEVFPKTFHDIAQGRPRTFGDALKRARDALPKTE